MCCVLIADVRQQVSDILNLFTGTHNFHNFTSGKYAVILISAFYMMRISGVARICCQEGHESYWVFTLGDCRL